MRSNYKDLGKYIRQVDTRNVEDKQENLLGVSTQKKFIESIANTVGTDFKKYKVVKKYQFTYVPDTSRRGDKIGIAMLETHEEALVSQAYTVFEIIDSEELLPEYLMMWFRRPEFDRYARYMSHGSVREIFGWEEMCDIELPIPSIEKQREIVREYHTITECIRLNEQLNQKLEETAQALYRQWFNMDEVIDTENSTTLEQYIEFNPTHSIKKDTLCSYVEMADVQEDSLSIKQVAKRPYTAGSKFQNGDTLLARITPCLENGKTAFVDCLEDGEIAFGSTEFIVMRAKNAISPFWIYCFARDEQFRTYAISSMIGSSGRERVHSDYLNEYPIMKIDLNTMQKFHEFVQPIFERIKAKSKETQLLNTMRQILLAKMATIEVEIPKERD
ncbi:MAG: hypothetical protein JU82_00330 [Sulfuricurvum sp. MLSB]|uniref:restriction endonuclease subunit S n=1 Tax=unclassified Sulfuricurvum TaxID=2632390 RepID=UPI0005008BD0|nr:MULTISPECIES: restriction endonuclease subunit S [unclassified Sulfuricurvum]KFN40861.1 MAG: hypothetical protein JU82_00330 [Sulfuricurvum sp. MLSB]